MARNTPLVLVRGMLKSECQKSGLSTSTAQDAEINQIIFDTQQWLASSFDWPFLQCRWDITVQPGSRYLPFPTQDDDGNTYSIDFERAGKLSLFIKWNEIWQPIEYGIRELEELNYIDSDLGQVLDPVQRWQFDDEGKFEIWPINASTQTLRFVGQRNTTELRIQLPYVNNVVLTNAGSGYTSAPTVSFSGGGGSGAAATAQYSNGFITGITITNGGTGYTSAPTVAFAGGGGANAAATAYTSLLVGWNDAATVNLDDLMVAYYGAAEYALREEREDIGKLLLSKGNDRMSQVRRTYPVLQQPCTIGGGTTFTRKQLRLIPMVVVGSR